MSGVIDKRDEHTEYTNKNFIIKKTIASIRLQAVVDIMQQLDETKQAEILRFAQFILSEAKQ